MGSTSLDLNWSIRLNQKAYLPASPVEITFPILNNYSQALESAQLYVSISQPNVEILEGTLSQSGGCIPVNGTWVPSLKVRIPEDVKNSMDLVFVLDSSGSMADEVSQVRSKILEIVDELVLRVSVLRIGLVIYGSVQFNENPRSDARDVLPLTSDVNQVRNFINQFPASGGWEPWGDAFTILEDFNWEGYVKLAILIGDEPCDSGIVVGNGNPGWEVDYDGPLLWNEINRLASQGIIMSSVQCSALYSDDKLLPVQFEKVAEIGGGTCKKLDNALDLITAILDLCEEAIDEIGIKVQADLSFQLGGTTNGVSKEMWILIDNQGPSLFGSFLPLLFFDPLPNFKFRFLCKTYDLSGIANVTLNYYWSSEGPLFISRPLNKSGLDLFFYDFPEINQQREITYYLNGTDFLGNPSNTSVSTTNLDDVSKLNLNQPNKIILFNGESTFYSVKITNPAEVLLTLYSSYKFWASFIAYNNVSTTNLTFYLGFGTNFVSWGLDCFSGKGWLFIQCLEQNGRGSIDVALHSIEIIRQSLPAHALLDSTNSSRVYCFEISQGQTGFWHLNVTMEDPYSYFDLWIFNISSVLKRHSFDKICVFIETPGKYYFQIQKVDWRTSISHVEIRLGQGFIADIPIFQGAPAACLVMWPLFLAVWLIGVVACYTLTKAVQLRIPLVLRLINEDIVKKKRNRKSFAMDIFPNRSQLIWKLYSEKLDQAEIDLIP